MINEKNFFSENKKINVTNTSSLVNLKAELFKKKQDAIRSANGKQDFEKINNTKALLNSKWNQKAIQLDQKVRNSIRSGKVKKSSTVEDEQLEKELMKSKESLERKTKIYEEKMRDAYESLMNRKDDEHEEKDDDDLIDFERKLIDASKQNFKYLQPEKISSSSSRIKLSDEEEQVEYVDSFGRTRYCKRKELNKIEKLNEQELFRRNLDRDLTKDEISNRLKERSTNGVRESMDMYSDLYSNFIKSNNDEPEQSNEEGEAHYQTVSKDEIREHGTSYYQFSLDEEKRKQQMQELDKLRNQTIEQRKKADEKIEKSNQAIKQRLLKLARRRGLVAEDELLDVEEASEKIKLNQYIKNVPKICDRIESTDIVDYPFEPKERKLREWDKDKIDELPFFIDKQGSNSYCDKKENNYSNDNESSDDEDKIDQFAPPSFYESSSKSNRRNNKKFKSNQSVEDKVDEFLGQFG